MVNRALSYVFRNRYGKQVMILTSISINLGLLIFSFLYFYYGEEKRLLVLAFSCFYVSTKSVFDFYLYKSNIVLFDDNSLYVKTTSKKVFIVPRNNILTIKRVFFYFYKISFMETFGLPFREIYYFISPNPSFFRQKELKEILMYVKNH